MDQVHRIVKKERDTWIMPSNDAKNSLCKHGLLITRAIEAMRRVVVEPEVSCRCEVPRDHTRPSALGGVGFRVNVGDIAAVRATCSGKGVEIVVVAIEVAKI
eukprot:COSAG02_NODE_5176_length_4570_cov_1.927086_4_plen_102_part_00